MWFVRSLGTLNALIELGAQERAATSRDGSNVGFRLTLDLKGPQNLHDPHRKSGSIGCFSTPLKSMAVKEKNPQRTEKMR